MPRIRLQLSEVRAGALPPVCLVCGRVATLYVARSFSWRPASAAVLSLLMLCVCLPVAITLFVISRSQTRRVMVNVPLCNRHRHYWLWRAFWITVPLLILVAVVIALGILSITDLIPEGVYYLTFFSCIVMFAAWLAATWFITKGGVKAVEITDDDVTLEPVSTAFFDVVRYERTMKKAEGVPVWDEYDPYPRRAAWAAKK